MKDDAVVVFQDSPFLVILLRATESPKPEIPLAPARLIPNYPLPEEKPEPDRWVLRVQVPQPGMER
jgi:hypothetical protein